MYAGKIIEIGTAEEVYYDPRHPYTWGLLSSLPVFAGEKGELNPIPGMPPSLLNPPPGDAFAVRNPQALAIDYEQTPPMFKVSDTHYAATWLLDERAPKIEKPSILKDRLQENSGRKQKPDKKETSFLQKTEQKQAPVLIEARNLKQHFRIRSDYTIHAVDDVSFSIREGEIMALVGETGCGKSTTARTLAGIYRPTGGEIFYQGERVPDKKDPFGMRKKMQTEIQMIFQDPQSSLNERAKVSYIVGEGLQNVRPDLTAAQREEKVRQALLDVGLLPEFASRFPHEFSGGQRQRIGIARALIVEPEFIIADEPISALDMSIRAQVLNLLRHLQKERGITYLFIAHDLSVMRYISDRIAVIHKGDIVELADAEELVTHAIHPYTRSLLSAIPMPNPRLERKKKLLVYDPAMHDYTQEAPQWRELRPSHWVLCSEQEAKDWLAEM